MTSNDAVIVLGSANMDLVVPVARHPLPGETIFGESLSTVPGGKGLNQAVACARAGSLVRFAGAVGTDEFGDRLVDLLTAEGIDVTALTRSDVATGTAHIIVDAAGQNSIVVVSGANAELAPSLVDRLDPSGVGWLLSQLEVPLPTVVAALGWACRHGIRSVLTPAPVKPLGRDVLGLVDLLVPNQIEAGQLVGVDDPVEAARQLSTVAGDVVVTLGSEGSLWAHGGHVRHVEPARPVVAVDTTAAGDTYLGVLVARLAEGADFPEAMRWAAAAAAIGVSRRGATSSMPTRAEVDALLA